MLDKLKTTFSAKLKAAVDVNRDRQESLIRLGQHPFALHIIDQRHFECNVAICLCRRCAIPYGDLLDLDGREEVSNL